MKPRKQTLPLAGLVLALATPAWAQVQKVAIRTTGISCGVCAAVSEIGFRRIPGVAKVDISLSQEAIMLSYKPGAAFNPRRIREVLRPLEVGVVQFQIGARGHIQEQGGKRFFVAAKDRFILAPAGNAPSPPLDTPLLIEAILDDQPSPMELRILNFKPAAQ